MFFIRFVVVYERMRKNDHQLIILKGGIVFMYERDFHLF